MARKAGSLYTGVAKLEGWASRLRGKAMESHSAGAMIVTYWRGTGEMQVSLRTIRTIAEESKP